ncbi:hypothetical protein G7054_g10630 [Neopestalotiopsis clavispora]|nr:hypothetical protein G7054_g10630 [Neopestalotiopsis clavispora]
MDADEKKSLPDMATEKQQPEADIETADVAAVLTPTTDDDLVLDRQLEKQVVRKLDWHLAPMFAALYFVAYLDRSNIGNASVAGLNADLGLSDGQYSTAVSVFFATYVALELPVVLLTQRVGPHRAIACMCLSWSAVTIGTGFVKGFGDLIATRVLLGLCEAGFFPCLILYISMVYKKEEQGLRQAYLFSSVALAGMFGGLIATGITYIGSVHGLESWSWLYIIEGCLSVLAAFWVFFGLPARPAEAKFLTAEDKNVMAVREAQRAQYLGNLHFEWSEVGKAAIDPKVWLTAFIQFFQDIILYGFSTFLPSILKLDLGYTSLQAQYLSVPVYALGGISFLTAALLSDKWRRRGTVLLALDIFAVIGYAILLGVPNRPSVRYFACFMIAIPIYCGPGLNQAYITGVANNMAPHYRRATAIGIQQTIGNLAGVVAPQVYRAAPYRLGHWCSLASVLISMGLISSQIGYLYLLNRKKSQISRGDRADDRKENSGEGDLDFRYVY